jgi:hypothetical protein
MKLKNFTPHNVVIVINNSSTKIVINNSSTKIVIPSDGIARVTETKTTTPSIDEEVENLPPQEEGVMLIVSALVASAAKGRDDLLGWL